MSAPQTTAKHMRSDQLAAIARQIRRHSVSSTHAAGSGHPTSSMSCAELLAVLFFEHLRYNIAKPHALVNDRFVLSKGHAAPALWGALVEAGAYPPEELQHLREHGSELEGHPTTRSPFVDVPTGSLGQGLSVGLGMALTSHRYGVHNHIWVLTGDSELSEGSNWEAAALASHYCTGRLTVIIDANGLGQSGPTMDGRHVERYEQRFAAFGWRTRIIDGHDITAIDEAYHWAAEPDSRPAVIIAETVKGKGVGFLENAEGRHGKALSGEEYDRAMQELGAYEPRPLLPVRPPEGDEPHLPDPTDTLLPDPDFGEEEATRAAYGDALLAMTDRDKRVLVLDGEVSNSTKSEKAAQAHPESYIEGYIAEQNMVGMALGVAALGSVPCVSSFAAFLSRAADQLRMAGLSGHHLVVAGSHAGISIGQDGPSQMGLEDVALFRSINGSTVLCPSDAVSAYRLTEQAIAAEGLVYIRLARPKTPCLYGNDDHGFAIGGSRLLTSSNADCATVIACGICVAEAMRAAEQLAQNDIRIRVLDAYSIKPLHHAAVQAAVADTGTVIVVEDHYESGGLGEAVAASLLASGTKVSAFEHLAVRGVPRSAAPEVLMRAHRIDADAIAAAVRRHVR